MSQLSHDNVQADKIWVGGKLIAIILSLSIRAYNIANFFTSLISHVQKAYTDYNTEIHYSALFSDNDQVTLVHRT